MQTYEDSQAEIAVNGVQPSACKFRVDLVSPGFRYRAIGLLQVDDESVFEEAAYRAARGWIVSKGEKIEFLVRYSGEEPCIDPEELTITFEVRNGDSIDGINRLIAVAG